MRGTLAQVRACCNKGNAYSGQAFRSKVRLCLITCSVLFYASKGQPSLSKARLTNGLFFAVAWLMLIAGEGDGRDITRVSHGPLRPTEDRSWPPTSPGGSDMVV